MKQEDKELLLKDLCARLPYKVICEDMEGRIRPLFGITLTQHFIVTLDNAIDRTNGLKFCTIDCVKPYLRPMSSMTEEEKEEFESLGWRVDELDDNAPWNHNSYNVFDGVDWLNKKMFDYRGLIPMGLALEAKEGMYNIKEE